MSPSQQLLPDLTCQRKSRLPCARCCSVPPMCQARRVARHSSVLMVTQAMSFLAHPASSRHLILLTLTIHWLNVFYTDPFGLERFLSYCTFIRVGRLLELCISRICLTAMLTSLLIFVVSGRAVGSCQNYTNRATGNQSQHYTHVTHTYISLSIVSNKRLSERTVEQNLSLRPIQRAI